MVKKICVIGMGYIGIPTACMFAKAGIHVVGVDVKQEVVDGINNGTLTIDEPNLTELIKQVTKTGYLRASLSVEEADCFIISVPTPITVDKKADMSYVESAAKAILPVIKKGDMIILESTSPPLTVLNIIVPVLEQSGLNAYEDLYIAHSPERVIPGKILTELIENDRIVGGINEKSALMVKELYETFVKGEIYITDATTAEMCKLMENTYRDVNIAFSNEIAKICEQMGINCFEAIKLANKHPRVNILQPGPGVGGHCIAVDPWFIVEKAPQQSKIIKLSRQINDSMPMYVYEKAYEILHVTGGKTVTILGITYKPNVDDIRESPVIELMELFIQNGFNVKIADPHVKEHKYKHELNDALNGSSLCILGVNHDEFKDIDFQMVKNQMKHANILDTRNFFDAKSVRECGINYYLMGYK